MATTVTGNSSASLRASEKTGVQVSSLDFKDLGADINSTAEIVVLLHRLIIKTNRNGTMSRFLETNKRIQLLR